jgi:hypothetical protein
MMAPSGRVSPDLGCRQTDNQRVDQILFNGSRNLRMRQGFRPCLGKTAGLRMQAPQARGIARGGPQHLSLRQRSKGAAAERSGIMFEPGSVQRHQVPDGGPRRPLVEPLAAAVEHDFPGLQFGTAPYWQRAGARWKGHEDELRWERQLGCPRQVFGPGQHTRRADDAGHTCRRECLQEPASGACHWHSKSPFSLFIVYALSSRLTSSRNRQSVPSAMIFCRLDLIRPASCRRNA